MLQNTRGEVKAMVLESGLNVEKTNRGLKHRVYGVGRVSDKCQKIAEHMNSQYIKCIEKIEKLEMQLEQKRKTARNQNDMNSISVLELQLSQLKGNGFTEEIAETVIIPKTSKKLARIAAIENSLKTDSNNQELIRELRQLNTVEYGNKKTKKVYKGLLSCVEGAKSLRVMAKDEYVYNPETRKDKRVTKYVASI